MEEITIPKAWFKRLREIIDLVQEGKLQFAYLKGYLDSVGEDKE